MKNSVKHPRRRFQQKQIMAFSCQIFLEKTPFQTSDRVRNTPLQRRDNNDLEKPMAYSLTISRVPAINLGRKRTSASHPKILCALFVYIVYICIRIYVYVYIYRQSVGINKTKFLQL